MSRSTHPLVWISRTGHAETSPSLAGYVTPNSAQKRRNPTVSRIVYRKGTVLLPLLGGSSALPKSNPCEDSFYSVLLNILHSIGGISLGRNADALFTLTQATEMLERTDFYVSGTLNASVGAGSDGRPNPPTFGLKMCQARKQDFRETMKKAREEMWGYLPRWFGLVGLLETELVVPRV